MSDFRTFAHLSPPLRCEDDRRACISALADGTIDVLASGHDPRGPEEKRLPFADSAPGAAGAKTLLALAIGLAETAGLDHAALFALLAANPARILGIDAGTLAVGQPADLILFDPGTPWQVDTGVDGNTPFDGLPVQGKVLKLFKGGKDIPAAA